MLTDHRRPRDALRQDVLLDLLLHVDPLTSHRRFRYDQLMSLGGRCCCRCAVLHRWIAGSIWTAERAFGLERADAKALFLVGVNVIVGGWCSSSSIAVASCAVPTAGRVALNGSCRGEG